MTTLFISDLHLDAERPDGIDRFLRFIETEAREASALYILGDLFEVWIGDDDTNPSNAPIIKALAALRLHNIPCYFMHGNRDFLIGGRNFRVHFISSRKRRIRAALAHERLRLCP